jgi:hypothetical protein
MIRHDHEFAQTYKWEMIRDVGPALIRDCTYFGMVHETITDFPEMIGAIPGANRDEIHPGTCIIPSPVAYGVDSKPVSE